MGKIKSCSIKTKGSRQVYRPGETVSGTVALEIEGTLKIRHVVMYCNGQGLTKWRKTFQRLTEDDAASLETYIKTSQTLYAANPPTEHQTSVLKYNFSFILPREGLPSSFEGRLGAIRYWLTLEVDKPFPSINDIFYRGFTVLAHLNVNDAVYRRPVKASSQKALSKALGIGDAGALFLTASLDRSGYCPGENISISLEVKNESVKDLGRVKAALVQRVSYIAGTETDSTVYPIRILEGDKLEKGKSLIWTDLKLLVDAVPPSTKHLTTHIILISYFVKFTVEVPLGINLDVSLPIKIGTVPLGTSVPTVPRLVSQGHYVIDSNPSINYAVCKELCDHFEKSFGNFVNLKYNPQTAFVNSNLAPSQAQAAPVPSPAVVAAPAAQQPTIPSPASSPALPPLAPTAKSAKPSQNHTVQSTFPASPQSAASALPAKAMTADMLLQYQQPSAPPPLDQQLSEALPAKAMTADMLLQYQQPSAPPLLDQQLSEAPPSYEQAMSCPSNASPALAVSPAQSPSLGSVVMLLFPCQDAITVGEYFKFNTPNLLLHAGKVLAFIPEIEFIPSQVTAALLIYFESQIKALSWLQTITSSNPELSSTWLAMVAENRVVMPKPGHCDQYACVTISLLKRNAQFKGDKAYWDEYKQLLKTALNPTKLKHKALTPLSGKVVFGFGDWSSFPVRATDLTLVVIQLPSLDHNKAMWDEFETDTNVKRFYELMSFGQTYLFRSAFRTGDISMFQDL